MSYANKYIQCHAVPLTFILNINYETFMCSKLLFQIKLINMLVFLDSPFHDYITYHHINFSLQGIFEIGGGLGYAVGPLIGELLYTVELSTKLSVCDNALCMYQ